MMLSSNVSAGHVKQLHYHNCQFCTCLPNSTAPHFQFLTQPLTNFSLVIGWVEKVFGSEQLQREGFGRDIHGGSKRVRKEIDVEQKRSKIRQAQIVRQTDQVSLQLFLSVSQEPIIGCQIFEEKKNYFCKRTLWNVSRFGYRDIQKKDNQL